MTSDGNGTTPRSEVGGDGSSRSETRDASTSRREGESGTTSGNETETGTDSGTRDGRGLLWRVENWILLDGNRLVVAGGLLALLTVVLVGIERLGWIPMARDQPAFYAFGAFISGNLTLITVVVSINQLLLSQELEPPGKIESQIRNVVEYRRKVEDEAGQIAPVEPLGFLRLLFESTRQEAQRVGGMTFGAVSSDVRDRVDDTVESLTDDMDRVLDLLGESDSDTFEVLSVTLRTNYARDINCIRRIRADHGDDLPETATDALGNLVHYLQQVDVARQYFKSLYLQQELSSLSRVLLYAGIPAELLSVVTLLGFTARPGTTFLQHVRLLLPIALAVGFLPLCVLFAYVVRIATVTQRTAATIPFTTPEQEQSDG